MIYLFVIGPCVHLFVLCRITEWLTGMLGVWGIIIKAECWSDFFFREYFFVWSRLEFGLANLQIHHNTRHYKIKIFTRNRRLTSNVNCKRYRACTKRVTGLVGKYFVLLLLCCRGCRVGNTKSKTRKTKHPTFSSTQYIPVCAHCGTKPAVRPGPGITLTMSWIGNFQARVLLYFYIE